MVAATGDQLLCLHEELDFANAAASELDVVTGNRDLPMAADGMDLALHRMDIVDGGEVEILAPDVRRQHFQEACARLPVARDGTRLDEGSALPVLPAAFVVALRGRERDGDGRAARVGTEAQIGAEDIAVRRPLLQHLHEIFRDTNEEIAVV